MADFAEVEKLALALSQHERARLAAKLLKSLPEIIAGDSGNAAGGFQKVNSSMLRRIRYDAENKFLDVVFRTGEAYRYKGVPQREYEALMKADSHGKYMQRHIIDHYDAIRIQI